MWDLFDFFKQQIFDICNVFGFYLLWILLFYIGSNLHSIYCTPKGLLGFFYTPVLVQAPHCIAFRWIISTGTNNINVFWGILAGFFIKKLKNNIR